MKTETATIQSLMDQVSKGHLRLPEIQRAYVWKPAQVAGLLDSLYQSYPSGSLLLWETTEQIVEKALDSRLEGVTSQVAFPRYLLDGQQRLTSLHRIMSGHESARVVFNVGTERFQMESAATKKDARWVSAHDLLNDKVKTFHLTNTLKAYLPELPEESIHERLERVRRITRYAYHMEILDDLPYDKVTEVFVRVNSRGRALKDTDLALATLSARWPGVVARVRALEESCEKQRYRDLDAAFLVRALAALVSDSSSPKAFAIAPIEALETAWKQLENGVQRTINLLSAELGLNNSKLLPSANALVPVVFHLGTRSDELLGEQERKAIVYWLMVVFLQARYSQSAATIIAQDVAALRSPDPFPSLYKNLGLFGKSLEVSAGSLAGKGSTSPLFFLSYVTLRRMKARDWWFGTPVSLSHTSAYNVEYHHIHPRARLKESYGKEAVARIGIWDRAFRDRWDGWWSGE